MGWKFLCTTVKLPVSERAAASGAMRGEHAGGTKTSSEAKVCEGLGYAPVAAIAEHLILVSTAVRHVRGGPSCRHLHAVTP